MKASISTRRSGRRDRTTAAGGAWLCRLKIRQWATREFGMAFRSS